MSSNVSISSPQKSRFIYGKLFAIKNFKMLFFSQLVSDLGDGVYRLGLLWAIKELTGSAVQMSLVLAANLIPTIVVGLISGVLVDSGDKKRFMIISDIARGVIMALVTLLWILHLATPWVLISATALLSCFSAFFAPARAVTLRYIVPTELMTISQSLTTALQTIIGLSSPVLAGLLLAWDISYAFIFNSITFFVSLLFVIFIKNDDITKALNKTKLNFKNIYNGLKDGLQVIKSENTLMNLIIFVFFINLIIAPVNVILPMYVDEVSSLGATALASFEGALFCGVFLGSILAGYTSKFKRIRVVTCGLLTVLLSFAALAFATNFVLALVCMTLIGAGISQTNIPLQSLFMVKIPMPILGRAASIIRILTMSSPPIAYLMTGTFLVLASVRSILLIISALGIILTLLMIKNKNMLND